MQIVGVGVGYDWDADEVRQSKEGVVVVIVEVRGGRVVMGVGFISREIGRAAECRWWLAGAPQLGLPPAWPLGASL